MIRRVEEEASQDVPLFTSLSLTKDQRDLRNRNKAAKLVVGRLVGNLLIQRIYK